MAFTNPTPYFGLPGYIGTDKPTFLGDFNTAFSTIDTTMQDNKLAAEGAQSAATAASAKADSAVDKSDANAQNLVILDNRLATQTTRIDGIIADQVINRYRFDNSPATGSANIYATILRNIAMFDYEVVINSTDTGYITLATMPTNIFNLPPSVSLSQVYVGPAWGRLTDGSVVPVFSAVQWTGSATNFNMQRLNGAAWVNGMQVFGEATHLFT